MSVILDALRRARGAGPSRPSPAPPQMPGIPAGLRAGAVTRPKAPRSAGGARKGLIVGVVLAGAVVWAGVYFGLPVLQRRMAAPRIVAVTTPRTPAPATPGVAATSPAAPPAVAAAPPGTAVPPGTAGASAPAAPASPAPSDGPLGLLEIAEKVSQPPPAYKSPLPEVSRADPSGATLPPAATRRAATRRPAPERPPLAAPPAAAASAATAAVVPPQVNHFDLAVRYHSLGNFEQALTHYTAVLQAEEFNVEARNNLALLYSERGLTGEAIEQFRRAILINPEYLKARSNLAVVLMHAGRLAEARAELRAAMALDPRNVDLIVNMALVEKADGHPERAREMLMRALGYQATHAAAHYNLGVLCDEAGDVGQAYDHYTDFLRNAGPEYGARLSDVRQRLDALAPKLDALR